MYWRIEDAVGMGFKLEVRNIQIDPKDKISIKIWTGQKWLRQDLYGETYNSKTFSLFADLEPESPGPFQLAIVPSNNEAVVRKFEAMYEIGNIFNQKQKILITFLFFFQF